MRFERARAKQSVKQIMKRTNPSPILITLLFSVVVAVVTGLLNSVLGAVLTGGSKNALLMMLEYLEMGYEVEDALEKTLLEIISGGAGFIFGMVVGGTVLSIIVRIWQSMMNTGYSGYALAMIRGENPQAGTIFCAFPRFVPVLLANIFVGLFVFLWMLLFSVVYCVGIVLAVWLGVTFEITAVTVLLILVFTVLYAIASIWVSMRYLLVDFAVLDEKLSGLDAVGESKRLMKGRIGQAVVLQLSFVGWYILISLIMWIGVIMSVVVIVLSGADGVSVEKTIIAAVVALVIMAVSFILTMVASLWLRPYVRGSIAMFYEYAKANSGGPYSYAANGYGPGPGGPVSGGGPGPQPPRPGDTPWN